MKRTLSCLCLLSLAVAPLLPASFAADAPPPWKVRQTTRPQFPPSLMQQGITHGETRIRFTVAPNGQLTDALVIGSTRPEFGAAALDAVKRWRFDPPTANGEPVSMVGDIVVVFEMNSPIAIERRIPSALDTEDNEQRYQFKAAAAQKLDQIPVPVHVVAPVYPDEWAKQGIKGRATVQYFIDEQGVARVPMVTAATHPYLGAAALAAVTNWRFEPPKFKGQPVLVRVEQDFTFDPDATKSGSK